MLSRRARDRGRGTPQGVFQVSPLSPDLPVFVSLSNWPTCAASCCCFGCCCWWWLKLESVIVYCRRLPHFKFGAGVSKPRHLTAFWSQKWQPRTRLQMRQVKSILARSDSFEGRSGYKLSKSACSKGSNVCRGVNAGFQAALCMIDCCLVPGGSSWAWQRQRYTHTDSGKRSLTWSDPAWLTDWLTYVTSTFAHSFGDLICCQR